MAREVRCENLSTLTPRNYIVCIVSKTCVVSSTDRHIYVWSTIAYDEPKLPPHRRTQIKSHDDREPNVYSLDVIAASTCLCVICVMCERHLLLMVCGNRVWHTDIVWSAYVCVFVSRYSREIGAWEECLMRDIQLKWTWSRNLLYVEQLVSE